MFSPDFNPLLEVLKNHTDSSGNVNWNALISEVKTMASLFAGKAEMPHKGTAMEEMMKKMAESQGEEVAWQAAIGTDPIKDAFEVKKFAHASGDAQIVPPPFVPMASDLLVNTKRTTRSAAYINVPFCQTRCAFCMFYIGAYKPEESKRYTDALIKEIRMWQGSKALEDKPIHAVYMGGGTPTALKACDLERIITTCREVLPLSNDYEFTVEGRLSFFDDEKIEACLKAGANRFSLGVQTFDTEIRQSVGRLSTKDELIRGLENLSAYDESSVVIDLIFGLPGQTEDTWREDLDIISRLPIHGVDLYQLILLEGSPLQKLIKAGKYKHAPDNRERAEMYRIGCNAMEKAHWKQLSVSHFGRNTRERNLYNVLAKSDADTLAFGPGAGGKIQGLSFMNTRKYEDYLKKVEGGVKPISMMFVPGENWRLYKDLGEELELGFVDFDYLKRRHGVDLAKEGAEVFTQWQDAGLLKLNGRFVDLTLAGRFWAVTMSQLLTNYLQKKLKNNS